MELHREARRDQLVALAREDLRRRRLVRREVVNEARRSVDLLWALGSPEEFLSAVELDGVDYVYEAAARGRGVVLAGPHMGGWELATSIPREILNLSTTAVVSDDWLAWAIEHARVGAGLKLMYDTDTSLRAARCLEAGEALLVIGDNALGHQSKTLRVRLLDGTVALPRGIARLSRLCHSPIVSFYVLPLGPRRWRVSFDAPVDPPPRRGGDAAEQETPSSGGPTSISPGIRRSECPAGGRLRPRCLRALPVSPPGSNEPDRSRSGKAQC